MTAFVWLATTTGEYFIPTSNIARIRLVPDKNMTEVRLTDGGYLYTKESPQSIVERSQEAQYMLLETLQRK